MKKFFKRLFARKETYPVIISELIVTERGEVVFDPNSRDPNFVQYNTTRLLIKKAKDEGKKSVVTALSTACWDAIAQDGYKIELRKNFEPGHSERHMISWG